MINAKYANTSDSHQKMYRTFKNQVYQLSLIFLNKFKKIKLGCGILVPSMKRGR